jgi:hypothetical protein
MSTKPKGWMANHARWCNSNKEKIKYKLGSLRAVAAMNAKRAETGISNQYDKAKANGLPIPDAPNKGLPGFFTGKNHSEETKLRQKKKALASQHRRMRRNIINYNEVMLDSTWELELAKRLDFLGVSWIRPKPIKWIDEQGFEHNYFADFYLTDYNIYLDPKNPYAVKSQEAKLKCLMEQYDNIVIIKSLTDCKSFAVEIYAPTAHPAGAVNTTF